MVYSKIDLISMCEYISPQDYGIFDDYSVDDLESFILSFYSSIDDCYEEYINGY